MVTYCSTCLTYTGGNLLFNLSHTGTYLKRKTKNVNNDHNCKTNKAHHKKKRTSRLKQVIILVTYSKSACFESRLVHLVTSSFFYDFRQSVEVNAATLPHSSHLLPSISFKIHHLSVILIVRRCRHIGGLRYTMHK